MEILQRIRELIKKAMDKLRLPVRLSMFQTLTLIFHYSLFLTVLMIAIQPGNMQPTFVSIVYSNWIIFVLNWLPVLAFLLLLYFIFNSTVLSVGVVSFVMIMMSFVNNKMINMRSDPFKPFDIMLGTTLFTVAKSLDKKLFILAGGLIVAAVVGIAFGMFIIKNKPIRPAVRIILSAMLLTAMIGANSSWYSDKDLNAWLYVGGNGMNQTDNFQSKGFLYSFIYTANTSRITKPPGYDADKKKIEQSLDRFIPEDKSTAIKPNIVVVLSEAFSEIALSDRLNFDGYPDPLENYKQIKASSYSGYIVTPSVGGGTADTEFDILTALNTRQFRGTPYAFSLVTKPTKSLATVLAGQGYVNTSMHPGYGWAYNRQNAYKNLGFGEFYDISTYDKTDMKGLYITERQTIDRMISRYEQHVADAPDSPLLMFSITIQNHGPFDDKYGSAKNFNTDLPITEQSVNAMSNYFEGLRDCDIELKRLTDYFNSRPEPVVMLYFGDHLPSFATDAYEAFIPQWIDNDGINGFRNAVRMYKEPYIIWQNNATRATVNLDDRWAQSPLNDRVVSSNYLGAGFLDVIGLSGIDPFYDYTNELCASYPVIMENNCYNNEYERKTHAEAELVGLYKSWSYYGLMR